MKSLISPAFHFVTAVILGGLLVTLPLMGGPILVGLATVLLLGVQWLVNRWRPNTITTRGQLLAWAVLTLIVVGAFLAPVKTCETMLERRILLPDRQIEVGEFAAPMIYRNSGLPYVSIDFDASTLGTQTAEDTVIQFTQTELTFREFINTMEEQTGLEAVSEMLSDS